MLESIFSFENINIEENSISQFSKIVRYNSVRIFRILILTLTSISGYSLSLKFWQSMVLILFEWCLQRNSTLQLFTCIKEIYLEYNIDMT
jgi:hypothetical protein